MPNYEVEIEGEISERVWGFYEVEATSEEHARERAITEFYDDNYGVEVVETYVKEATD